MIQPPFTPSLVPVDIWFWIALALAAVAAGAAAYGYRGVRRREETIRRQLARESALKARLDDIFERSSDIIVIHDRRGRVTSVNRAGEQATGYQIEELRTLDPNWIFGADYLDHINQLIAEGADSTPRVFHSTLSQRRGVRVPVDVDARVMVGDGQVAGVVAIARNLSERDRLETELRQAQKMEAVGRLATGIAHDFNNLITVLIGYSDELLEEAPEGSPVHHAATSVRRAAERASGLTQQLLAFSRRQGDASNIVDLNRLVHHMEDMVRRLIGPEIRLEITLQPDLGSIEGDESRLGQVLMNLVVNARDAMPKGGTLTITTANVELGAEHVDLIPGAHVQLTVADTGQGMSSEVQKRLFEPFFTTKERGQGTGLGLSMVQAIVRQCGGHVVVDSQPGSGTRFHAYFPRKGAAAEAAPAAALPAARPAAVRGEGVILLAEDDASVRRLVVMELTRRGFTVLEAEDGRQALDVLQRERQRIDMLVTDVVMPRMNGADLAKEVERLSPGLKVLFISGHPERAGAGLDPAGVTNLLMKPFTADTLARRIKEMMARA